MIFPSAHFPDWPRTNKAWGQEQRTHYAYRPEHNGWTAKTESFIVNDPHMCAGRALLKADWNEEQGIDCKKNEIYHLDTSQGLQFCWHKL